MSDMMNDDKPRQPSGSPTGGQWTSKEHGDTTLSLAPTPRPMDITMFGERLDIDPSYLTPSHYPDDAPRNLHIETGLEDDGRVVLFAQIGDHELNITSDMDGMGRFDWGTYPEDVTPEDVDPDNTGELKEWLLAKFSDTEAAYDAAHAVVRSQVNEQARLAAEGQTPGYVEVGTESVDIDQTSDGTPEGVTGYFVDDDAGSVTLEGSYNGRDFTAHDYDGEFDVEWSGDGFADDEAYEQVRLAHHRAAQVLSAANAQISAQIGRQVSDYIQEETR